MLVLSEDTLVKKDRIMGILGKGGLVIIGGILLVVGFLLQSNLIEWLLDLMGTVLIVIGIIVVIIGLVSMVVGRKGGAQGF